MAVKSASEIKADIVKRTRGASYNRDFYKTLDDLADSGERLGLTVTAREEDQDIIYLDVQIVGSDGTTPVGLAKSLAVYALDPTDLTAAAVTMGPGPESSTMVGVGHPQILLTTDANGYAEFGVIEDVPGSELEVLLKILPVDYVGGGALVTIQFDDQAEGGGGGGGGGG